MRRIVRLATCLLLAAIVAGCQLPWFGRPAAPAIPPIVGRVIFPPSRSTQATINDVAKAATVSLIDPSANPSYTIATGLTDASGNFTINAGFNPTPGKVYILEALKGLDNNAVHASAARVRTFVEFSSDTWTSTTGSAINITSGTTALCVVQALQTNPAAGQPSTFIATLSPSGASACTDPDAGTFTPQASTAVTVPSYCSAEGQVAAALADNLDPIGVVSVDNGGNFGVSVSALPVVFQVQPALAAIGATISVVGQNFITPPASDTVLFGGTATVSTTASSVSVSGTSLVLSVPNGLTAGATAPIYVVNANGTSSFPVIFETVPNITPGTDSVF
ncbi:MAG: IPT/TIG domain-containing protein [Cyanobacteria bacterium REEB65]|nr:IPT/TIG domain-containing protein [Cyanobacteria bacterium REEB65]